MRIKKLTAVLLSAVMAISMCACTKEEKKPAFDEAAYLDKVTEEVTGRLSELSTDEGFIELYTSDLPIKDLIDSVKAAKIDTSKDYYELELESLSLADIMKAVGRGDYSEDDIPELSETGEGLLKRNIYSIFSSFVNGRKGQYSLVLSSILGYSRTYVPDEPVSGRARIIPTDKDIYYYVCFIDTGDGALTVNTTYLFFDEDLEKEFDEMFGEHFKKISR